jgi:hypothetical protein
VEAYRNFAVLHYCVSEADPDALNDELRNLRPNHESVFSYSLSSAGLPI